MGLGLGLGLLGLGVWKFSHEGALKQPLRWNRTPQSKIPMDVPHAIPIPASGVMAKEDGKVIEQIQLLT
jgi:hypothetical protein